MTRYWEHWKEECLHSRIKTIEEVEKKLVNHVRFNKRVVKKHLMIHDLLGVALSKVTHFML